MFELDQSEILVVFHRVLEGATDSAARNMSQTFQELVLQIARLELENLRLNEDLLDREHSNDLKRPEQESSQPSQEKLALEKMARIMGCAPFSYKWLSDQPDVSDPPSKYVLPDGGRTNVMFDALTAWASSQKEQFEKVMLEAQEKAKEEVSSKLTPM